MAEEKNVMNEEVEETVETEETNETEDVLEEAVETTETEEVADETAEENEEEKPKKEGFFKKKKDKKDEQIEELNDRVRRQMAEFDNFRKRTEKEKASMYQIGAREVIEKILPVVDNFERGLATVPQEDATNPYAEGMEKIYKQLMTVLDDLGVKAIEAVGQEFNPDFHNAVMQAPSEEYESGIVIQELQRGYVYKEKVIRYSMVMVAE